MLHDKDIREPLFDFLEMKYGKTRILEEKTMGKSRADVVMVTERDIYGIEIKSDADTYARLERQVKDYDRFYDYNYVVVGTSHAMHIREHVPEYWGVITVELLEDTQSPPDSKTQQQEQKNSKNTSERKNYVMDFYVLRQPSPNPKVTWKMKMKILWKSELASIQDYFSMPKYAQKSKEFVIGKITERIPDRIDEENLRRQFCEQLLEREYNR